MNRAFGFAFISFLTSFLIATACLPSAGNVAIAETAIVNIPASINWDDCLKQSPEWYRTSEAVRIADNVLLYQRQNGGWPKNIDMAAVLSDQDKPKLVRQKH